MVIHLFLTLPILDLAPALILDNVSHSLFRLSFRTKNDLEKREGVKILHILISYLIINNSDPQSFCYCLKYLN